MIKKITIATRKSPLALWQAEYVRNQLIKHHPDLEVVLLKMTTQGDEKLASSLAKIGGKGLFIKELEISMQKGEADIAVHSTKDIPYALPPGFELGAILQRENPFDAFVSNTYNSIDELPIGAKVGTCSLRRQAQLLAHRPDLVILDLRGNVNTRLQKLDAGNYDAIILACAGLIRLGFEHRIKQIIPAEKSLPAVGQGAVGIEIRENDAQVKALIAPLIDADSSLCITAERAMNAKLGGGCSSPIAGFAQIKNNVLTLNGLVGSTDGTKILAAEKTGSSQEAQAIGEQVAKDLIKLGAKDLLA